MERVDRAPWVTACARISGALEGGMWRPRQYFRSSGQHVCLGLSGSVSGPLFLGTEIGIVELWRISGLFPGDWSRNLAACSFGIESLRTQKQAVKSSAEQLMYARPKWTSEDMTGSCQGLNLRSLRGGQRETSLYHERELMEETVKTGQGSPAGWKNALSRTLVEGGSKASTAESR